MIYNSCYIYPSIKLKLMSVFIVIIFLVVGFISMIINDMIRGTKDFSEFIKAELRKNGMTFMSSTYPGLFKVGPFKKIVVTFGKPQINNGAIQYEKTYYRIVELKTKDNRIEKTWVKIETNWFKDTQIEFKPSLSELKNSQD